MEAFSVDRCLCCSDDRSFNHYHFRFYQSKGTTTTRKSIAVLPLVNGNNDSNIEYLSDGISETLINSLTELSQLKVIARSTAFRYKGKDVDPQQVGRELNVDTVLMGRVKQLGDNLDVQVQNVTGRPSLPLTETLKCACYE